MIVVIVRVHNKVFVSKKKKKKKSPLSPWLYITFVSVWVFVFPVSMMMLPGTKCIPLEMEKCPFALL